MPTYLKISLKILVSFGLIALLVYKLNWSLVYSKLVLVDAWIIIVAVGIQMFVFAMGNLRWWILIRTHELGHQFLDLLGPYFIGTFFNNLLPTSTGGDLFRVYYIHQQKHGPSVSISPVVTERIVGLVTMIGVATAATAFVDSSNEIINVLKYSVPWFFIAGIIGLVILGSNTFYRPLDLFLRRWSRFRLVKGLLNVTEACHSYIRIPSVVIPLIAISAFLQILEAVVFYLFGLGVGVELKFVTYVLIVPMIYVAASLPLSIGGLGVREAAAVTLFMAVGMSEGDAGAVAFLYIPVLIFSSLPGLIYFILLKNHKKYFDDVTHSKISV